MGKKLFITDTILRDAHQSQAATRMRVEDIGRSNAGAALHSIVACAF